VHIPATQKRVTLRIIFDICGGRVGEERRDEGEVVGYRGGGYVGRQCVTFAVASLQPWSLLSLSYLTFDSQ